MTVGDVCVNKHGRERYYLVFKITKYAWWSSIEVVDLETGDTHEVSSIKLDRTSKKVAL